jgi:hypothetical protein
VRNDGGYEISERGARVRGRVLNIHFEASDEPLF